MVFDKNVKEYMMTLTNFRIDKLRRSFDMKYEEMYSTLLSPENSRDDFLKNIWELDMLKLIINKREYDKMSNKDKEKRLHSFKADLGSFADKTAEIIETLYGPIEMQPITQTFEQIFESIRDDGDIVSFAIEWGKEPKKYHLIQFMNFNDRQSFYMVAILDYDCEIF